MLTILRVPVHRSRGWRMPSTISVLSRKHAIELRRQKFKEDCRELIDEIKAQLTLAEQYRKKRVIVEGSHSALSKIFNEALALFQPENCLLPLLPRIPDLGRIFVIAVGVSTPLLAKATEDHYSDLGAFMFTWLRPPFKVLPVALPLAPVPIGVFSLKNRTLSPVEQLFIEHARDVAKQLARKW